MGHALPVLVAFLAVIALVNLFGRRLRAPVPVLLALAGALLAFVPGLPHVELDPDLILVLFLPPLLYADAFDTSWIDFRRWLRPILLLAFGLVGFTILVVGLVAHACLPELPWPACFILGAIVSPTDTIAVQAVIERLRVPRRVTAILGGESLVNDAPSLVGVQIGVAVVLSGTFELGAVALDFAWVSGGGVAVGVGIGALFAWANRHVRETTVLFVLSLVSPYLALLLAHEIGTSGVLAVVVAGFVVSWNLHTIHSASRVDLYAAWTLLIFVLNGVCFVFIGYTAAPLLRDVGEANDRSLVVAGLGIAATVVLARISWTFVVGYGSLWLSPYYREREGGYPRPRNVMLVSWAGVRGVVSLAAALSLPHSMNDGRDFPGRPEIVACTLFVILVTLLFQGLTLLPLIRLLGIREDEDTDAEVQRAREQMLEAGIARLDLYCSEKSCPIAVHHFRESMADELQALRDADEELRQHAATRLAVSTEVRGEVFKAQQDALLVLRDKGEINDKSYVDLQLELDRQTTHRPGE
ncbi:MAG: Na+/H+ antiporter [Planctomycetota bacterium]